MATLAVPPTPSRQSNASALSFITARSGESTVVHVEAEGGDASSPGRLPRRRSSSIQLQKETVSKVGRDKEKKGPEQEDKVVRFEENDSANPRNWTVADLSTGMASTAYSPASTIYAEVTGLPPVTAELPLVLYAWGGRKPVYLGGHFLQLLFAIGAALSPTPAGLFILRFLGGCAGGMSITNLGASFADMWVPERTGVAMALFVLSDTIGPSLGYTACAPAAQFSGWRTTLWMTVGFIGVTLIPLALFAEETRHSIILEKRMKKKRKETGDEDWSVPDDCKREGWKQLVKDDIQRPLVFLATEGIIIAVAIVQLQLVGIQYLFTTSYTLVYGENGDRAFSTWQIGLVWFGFTIGALIGFATYPFEERHFRRATRRNGGVIVPEGRIGPLTCLAGIVYPASLFWFAWTSFPSIHWIVPTIATGFFGWAFFTIIFAFQAWITDGYGVFASSALAGADLLRSSGGGCFPLFGAAMYRNLGYDKASTVLAGLGLLATPLPFIFRKYGRRLRAHSPYARQHMEELEKEKEGDERDEEEGDGQRRDSHRSEE
ncbi:hypothetical protein JCM8547_000543 [Rhodosporidiobolus lusitaniae]